MIETKDKTLEFTEENIRAIFGHEAAEDESVDRLKAYYLKSDVYSKLKSAIPLYILAGHKGIGKSAMFKVLEAEDNENGDIALVIQPDDILELDTDTDQFLLRIRQWKNGLSSVIARKLITEIQIKQFELSTEKSNTFFSWVNKLSSVIKQVTGTKLEEMQGDFTGLDAEKFALIIKNQVFTEKKSDDLS